MLQSIQQQSQRHEKMDRRFIMAETIKNFKTKPDHNIGRA